MLASDRVSKVDIGISIEDIFIPIALGYQPPRMPVK